MLTKAGEMLYHASVALCQNDRMLKELLHSEQKEGPLDFGATLTIGEYLMADGLKHIWRRSFCKVQDDRR